MKKRSVAFMLVTAMAATAMAPAAVYADEAKEVFGKEDANYLFCGEFNSQSGVRKRYIVLIWEKIKCIFLILIKRLRCMQKCIKKK